MHHGTSCNVQSEFDMMITVHSPLRPAALSMAVTNTAITPPVLTSMTRTRAHLTRFCRFCRVGRQAAAERVFATPSALFAIIEM